MVNIDNHMTWPQIYSVWEHKNGERYMPILYANVEGDRPQYPTTIIYRNVITSRVYSRPLYDWDRSFTFIQEAHKTRAF